VRSTFAKKAEATSRRASRSAAETRRPGARTATISRRPPAGQRTRVGSTFIPGLRPFEPSNAIRLSRSEGKAQARFRAGSHGDQHLIGPSVEK
jgi:hypothetical protein